MLQALREGASTNDPTKTRDPRLPGPARFRQYRKPDQEFDRSAGEILASRRRDSRERGVRAVTKRVQRSGALPGKAYHWDAIAAAIVAGAYVGASARNEGFPSHTIIVARRKADPVVAAKVDAVIEGRRYARKDRPAIDQKAVLEMVRQGASIRASPPQPGMPSKCCLDRRRDDPAFGRAMLEAIKFAQRRKLAKVSHGRRVGGSIDWDAVATEIEGGALIAHYSPRRGSLPSEWLINRQREIDPAFAARIDPIIAARNGGQLNRRPRSPEAIEEIMLLEGVVAHDGDLTAAWKQCRTALNKHRWKESSLDATIPGTDHLTRLDLLPSDAVHL